MPAENDRPGGKFVPVFFLPVVEHGAAFRRWPLHITLFPPITESYDVKYGEELRRLVNPSTPFEVTVGRRAMFGPDADIPVQLIEASSQLQDLHYALVATVGRLLHDATYRQPYNPHISVVTEHDQQTVRPGMSVSIGGLSIAAKNRGDHEWTIVDKIGLKGNE